MYSCPFYKPRHLSVAIDKYKYKMPYAKLIGGVLNFKSELYLRVNGYSNQYWGWGKQTLYFQNSSQNLTIDATLKTEFQVFIVDENLDRHGYHSIGYSRIFVSQKSTSYYVKESTKKIFSLNKIH